MDVTTADKFIDIGTCIDNVCVHGWLGGGVWISTSSEPVINMIENKQGHLNVVCGLPKTARDVAIRTFIQILLDMQDVGDEKKLVLRWYPALEEQPPQLYLATTDELSRRAYAAEISLADRNRMGEFVTDLMGKPHNFFFGCSEYRLPCIKAMRPCITAWALALRLAGNPCVRVVLRGGLDIDSNLTTYELFMSDADVERFPFLQTMRPFLQSRVH